jgi:hypothetical protein
MAKTGNASVYGNVISSPIISFNGGLDTRLPENAAPNTFSAATNVSVTTQGLLTFRPGLKAWLPDLVDTVYQIYPAIYNGQIYYFACDDGVVKYIQDGDTAWTVCGGPNSVTTGEGIRYQFIHAEDKLYVANGNDNSRYIDLTTMEMVVFLPVTDPASAPTAAAFGSGLTYSTSPGGSTPYSVNYSINFNGDGAGQTINSPILTGYVSVDRPDWTGSNTYGLTITQPNSIPANATSWNIWISWDVSGGTVTNDDMLLLVGGLPLTTTVFNDDGTIQPNLNAGTAPNDNSTEGFVATYGTEIDGTVFLWGIVGNEYALMIGGTPGNAFDFTPTNGGYMLLINQGTNYFPTNLVSFRNSQGIPSLVMLYSNTQGTSIQTVIEQSTVNYGNYSFVVWGSTDQGRTVPASSSPYGVFAYNNSLYFPTASSVMELTTRPTTLNVLSVDNVAVPVADLIESISVEQLPNIVGAGINDRIYFSCAVNGFSYNNIILVYDITDPNNPRWYPWNITNNWFGIISPSQGSEFLYITQDNHVFKLEQGFVAQDEDSSGIPTPFSYGATGPLTGSNQDHSAFLALVQAMFYLINVVGDIQVTVPYSTSSPSGLVSYKSRTKTINGPEYIVTDDGNWTDYAYQFLPAEVPLLGWGENPVFNSTFDQQVPANYRQPVPVDQVVNEAQWSFVSNGDTVSSATLRSISYEGVAIGVKGDIQ